MAVYLAKRNRRTGARPEWPAALNPDHWYTALRGSISSRRLIGFWPLMQGSDGIDLRLSNHGTLTGSPVMGGTIDGSALFFDNVDDYVSIANPTTFSFQAPGSISFWFRGTTDDFNVVFSVSSSAATNNSYFVALGNGATSTLTNELITVGRSVAGTTTFTVGYTTAARAELFDGRPHHVCVVATGAQTLIYLDGRSLSVTTGFGTDGGQFTDVNSVDNALIGAMNNVGLGPRLFTSGHMHTVGIHSRALTAPEVWALYDPATRWDLYWRPSRTAYFSITAATGNPWYAYAQMRA